MDIPHPLAKNGHFYMENALYEQLKLLHFRIKHDKDVLFAIVGPPGSGKSTLGQQICAFLDPTFNINRIYYTFEEYMEKTIDMFQAGKSKSLAVMHDEARESLSSGEASTRRTKDFMKLLYENRQMNMYQCVLTGDFFDLPRSIVMQRLLFMIQVHEEGMFENGYFRFYNSEAMKKLYAIGKPYRDMKMVGYSLRGWFPKFYPVGEEEYRKMKAAHLTKDRYLGEKKPINLNMRQLIEVIYTKNQDADPKYVSEVLKCKLNYVYETRKCMSRSLLTDINYLGETELTPSIQTD